MFEKIITYSVRNKLIILAHVLALIIAGWMSIGQIPLDAVPDITNNQVQVVTVSPTLAPQEIEQIITFPIEAAVSNIPDVVEVRSISRYGLSVVTVVFEDNVDIMKARQFVSEQMDLVKGEIPEGLGSPELMPITTGLGEIYQYVLNVKPGYESKYNAMELRTLQDWIVKRQLAGTKGIIDISSFGGYLKQYEVAVDPLLLIASNVTINEVLEALKKNNENSGGSYIEKGSNAYYIRTLGRIENKNSIENIVINSKHGIPLRVRDVAIVKLGAAKRYGAMTMDGKGEVVGGITLMLKGDNSSSTIKNVKEKIAKIQKSLPEGIEIYPYLDRSELVGKTISTVTKNLIEGGLIVIFVLVLLLGNLRAGLIVASVIPLSMLFALLLMNIFGVSANLMSLGAIDFGIVVDGAVIIVEGVLHVLYRNHLGKRLSNEQMDGIITSSAGQIYKSAAFGVFIILIVFVPVLALQGIEGKMFKPMVQTVSFAIIGSLILSMTYVPVMTSLFLSKNISEKKTFADKIMDKLKSWYIPSLKLALKIPKLVIFSALAVFLISVFVLSKMGSEFIPTLEEGDLAMQQAIEPGSSLEESIRTSTLAEKILLDNFPEIDHVVSKIGTAEVPTDPMAIEDADVMIILKDKKHWVSADNREDLVNLMKEKLDTIKHASFEFTQPIQLRFNELMTGAKADIAVKIFGEDVAQLKSLADKAANIIQNIDGAGDVKVEQTEGLKQISIKLLRKKMAFYDINVEDVNRVIRSAYAGEIVGVIYENERRFDLALRLNEESINTISLSKLYVKTPEGTPISVSEITEINEIEGPMQISREDAKRRIVIGINVRNRDIASVVADIQSALDTKLELPPAYYVEYGGEFENLENAISRLKLAVPVALGLIFFILYLAFKSIKEALIIFIAVPMAAIGGIFILLFRGMPFSISAGIGFIALFGVAVLNGIVLISEFKRLKDKNSLSVKELVLQGASTRLRPVLMTALVASLGFLPMAISTSNGSEVQRPLASVVIGGLITSTLLTLILLPVIYSVIENRAMKIKLNKKIVSILLFLIVPSGLLNAQDTLSLREIKQYTVENHPLLKEAEMDIEKWEIQKKQSFLLDPLDISFEYGKINDDINDYKFQVVQDLGNPFAISKRNKLAKAGTESSKELLSLKKTSLIIQSTMLIMTMF
jgi:cobalt-zinc-cadmium resistance protein CzcA